MNGSKGFVSLLLTLSANRLDSIGYHRRKSNIFTLPINSEVAGWLGLNKALYRGGILRINPVTGIRHQKTALVADLQGTRRHDYIPPLASLCGLSLWAADSSAGRITITLDCRTPEIHRHLAWTESQVITATLECLRRVAGDELDVTPIETMFKPKGQEAIKKLVETFIRRSKVRELQPQ
jgi:hypothetical protein